MGAGAVIISASRRTDIPNYYGDWFFKRLEEKYVLVRNPMNFRQIARISLKPGDVDGIVFWSKNPAPMLSRLEELEGYGFYFQFTLNAYGEELEPGLPPLEQRISTFQALAEKIGPERVWWRYDPVLISRAYPVSFHMEAFQRIAQALQGSTGRVAVSFLDLYKSISKEMDRLGVQPPSTTQQLELAEQMAKTASENGMRITACCEGIDLSSFGFFSDACVDAAFLGSLSGRNIPNKKDRNQRAGCKCAASVDIGVYGSCPNRCRYCYANHGDTRVRRQFAAYREGAPLLCSELSEADQVYDRRL